MRALRYGQDHLHHLDQLVSPAVAGEPEDRTIVGGVHAYNIRQAIRGDTGPLASGGEPPFTHAARLLAQWKQEGVLVRDPRPALYVYEQELDGRARRGLVGLIRVEDYEDGSIRPHEETHGRSTPALTNQLITCQTQLSMVMALVPDEDEVLADYLSGFQRRDVEFWTPDGQACLNRVWRDQDPESQLRLASALRDQVAVIADGHHRYEAALAYRDQVNTTDPSRRERPSDYVMMLLVPADDPGLHCAPTHRICESIRAPDESLLKELSRCFEMGHSTEPDELFRFLDDPGGIRFGLVGAFGLRTLLLRESAKNDLASLAPALRDVDAAVADELLLAPLDELLVGGTNSVADLSASGSPFSHNRSCRQDIVQQTLSGAADLAVLLRGVPPLQVLRVALAGHLMPSKSTNFHPKPTKGLLMNSLRSF